MKAIRFTLSDSTRINIIRYVVSLIATLAVGAIIILLQGESPLEAFYEIFQGAFGTKAAIGSTLHWAVPCMLVGSAALVAFKSGVMNLGLEGQLYLGALAAGCVGYMISLPAVVHPIVCIIIGGFAGLLWAIVPALLKLLFKVDEVITTLLLNYVATLLTEVLTLSLISGSKALATTSIMTPLINDTAKLSPIIKGTSATTGIFVALIVVAGVWFLYKYTLVGYELKQVGENLKFAKAGGVNANKMFVIIFLLSGFVAGICGSVETLGVNNRFISQFSSNLGWDGVMITRVATNNPIGVLVVSFIWAAFKAGSLHLERVTELNRYTINLLQALFVVFISIDYGMIYRNYQSWKARKKMREEEASKAA